MHNTFPALLKYLDDINEAVVLSKTRLLIPVDPKILEVRELALLERNTRTIKEAKGA